MINKEIGSVELYDAPKAGSQKGKILTYITDNRIEGTRQVYSMPDLLKECGLVFSKFREMVHCLNVLYGVNFAGHQVTGSIIPTISGNGEYLELYVDCFGWELLSLAYSSVPFPKKPSEKIKNLIAKIDEDEEDNQ